MPVEGVAPGRQAVIGREIINVIDVKMLLRGGIGVKPLVQPAEEMAAPAGVPDIPVAHQAVVRPVKVVLDDGAAELLLQCLPHRLKAAVLPLQHCLRLPGRCGRGGELCDVAPGGVDINYIGGEGIQLRRAEHGVLPILAVLRLVELRLDAILQQKQAQLVGHLVGGGAAQDGNFFVQRMGVLRRQLAADAALFAQKGSGVQRILEAIHRCSLLVFSVTGRPARP